MTAQDPIDFASIFDPVTNSLDLSLLDGQEGGRVAHCISPLEIPPNVSTFSNYSPIRAAIDPNWADGFLSPAVIEILNLPAALRRLDFDCEGHFALKLPTQSGQQPLLGAALFVYLLAGLGGGGLAGVGVDLVSGEFGGGFAGGGGDEGCGGCVVELSG